jgi:hypothetical protein
MFKKVNVPVSRRSMSIGFRYVLILCASYTDPRSSTKYVIIHLSKL